MIALISSIRTELVAYAALLEHHTKLNQLTRYIAQAQPRFWGTLDLSQLDDSSSCWFTSHYWQPVERVRLSLGSPAWWSHYQERCLRKERWDHPSPQQQHSLAHAVVQFYSTLWLLLDGGPAVFAHMNHHYALLEWARDQIIKMGPE